MSVPIPIVSGISTQGLLFGYPWPLLYGTFVRKKDHRGRHRAWLCSFPGLFLALFLRCRPFISAPLLGLMSVSVCGPAFRSDQGLLVLWSSIMQGEELLKAISRV